MTTGVLGREFFYCRRLANSLLKCCAVIHSVLQIDAKLPQTCRHSVLQCGAVCCRELDYAPMRFLLQYTCEHSVLKCVTMCFHTGTDICGICHLHAYIFTYIYKCIYIHTHIRIYIYLHISTYVCVYICIYICIYIYTYFYPHVRHV